MTKLDQQRQREAMQRVIDWNARFDPGQVVEYRSHPEAPARPLKTASPAFVLTGGVPSIVLAGSSFKGLGGCVRLDQCRAVEASAAGELAAAMHLERTASELRREQIAARLRALLLEADLCRGELVAALASEPDRPLFQLTAAAREAGRRYESLAQACFDLEDTVGPPSRNPTTETS